MPTIKELTHLCHAHGCLTTIGELDWFCERHWSQLPKPLKAKLSGLFEKGMQSWLELPGLAYAELLKEADRWLAFKEGVKK